MENQSPQDIIRQMLKEGHRAQGIKAAFIEKGISTEGFYDVYYKILDELGMKETNLSSSAADYAAAHEVGQARKAQKSFVWVELVIKGLITIALIGFIFWVVFTGAWRVLLGQAIPGSEQREEGLTATDLAREANVRKTTQTAQIYKNKILDYSGLCGSIGLNEEVYNCVENKQDYAIETKLSNGRYYCADSAGFSGAIGRSIGTRASCLP